MGWEQEIFNTSSWLIVRMSCKGHVEGVTGDGEGVLGEHGGRAQGQRASSPVEPGAMNM